MAIEFELKYRVSQEALEEIALAMGPGEQVYEMRTAYYDTLAGDLSRLRYTLRRRYENGVSICTLKTPAGSSARQEWEVEAESIQEAIPMLCKLGCPQELPQLVASGLVNICGARFTRRAWTLEAGASLVELALDRGVLLGGGKEIPLYEMEVELKAGRREDAMVYARVLAEKYGLSTEEKSKFRRALDLAKEGA